MKYAGQIAHSHRYCHRMSPRSIPEKPLAATRPMQHRRGRLELCRIPPTGPSEEDRGILMLVAP